MKTQKTHKTPEKYINMTIQRLKNVQKRCHERKYATIWFWRYNRSISKLSRR